MAESSKRKRRKQHYAESPDHAKPGPKRKQPTRWKVTQERVEAIASRRWWRGCGRKRKFPSREAAFEKNCAVYECHYCGWYHRATVHRS